MRPLKTLVIGLSGLSFVIFWGCSIVVSWIWVPLVKLAAGRDVARVERHCQWIIRWFFRFFCHLMRGLRLIDVDRRCLNATPPDGPYVLVANHPTLIDVVALLASYDRICCVVKPSHMRGWIVGPLLRGAAYIEGAGARGPGGASDVIEASLDRIAKGYAVLIFPEGTRSPLDAMHKFQRSAFEVAARADVPLVPVHVHCSPPTLGKGVPWYVVPSRTVDYRLTQLSSIRIPHDRKSVREAATAVRSQLMGSRHERTNEDCPDRGAEDAHRGGSDAGGRDARPDRPGGAIVQ